MSDTILEMKEGTFSYENNRCALQHINVTIRKGEKIAVIGNNGAGKSTFFLSLNGVIRLDEGNIYHHGKEVDYSRKNLIELRKSVGMVFQDSDSQIIASTVQGEISFGLFNINWKKEQVQAAVHQVMKDMDLGGYENRPPHFLSGGEKKRVTIADIVVMNPEVILFDEPTASLDCEHIQIFKKQLDKLHQEHMTLIVSTHDMNFVWEWADRVIVFSDGEVIADDRPEKIFTMEDILDRAALRKPILLEAYEIMIRKNAIDCVWLPRTMEELKQAMISDKGDSTYE